MAKFQILRDSSGEYRWRLQADNQKIIASSGEGYKNKKDCEHAIDLVKNLSQQAEVEEKAAD